MTHFRRPERREIGVTIIALSSRGNVVHRLAECRTAIVAIRAVAGRAGLVSISHQRPAIGGGMARVTLRRGTDMGCWLGQCIAINIGTAVAGRALTFHAIMIHHCRRPCSEAVDVTGIALGGRRNMDRRFGQRVGKKIGAVVAGRAFTCRSCMIHVGRRKCSKSSVTAVTLHACRYVIGGFAKRALAIMAARTTSADSRRCCRMVEGGGRPGCRRTVTAIALRRGADMRCRFCLGIQRHEPTAVAIGTLSAHAGMIHLGRPETVEMGVAAIALRCRRHVPSAFPKSTDPIVATQATAADWR